MFGQRMALHCDPLKLLIEFLNSKGIRPVDLFRTFEQDEQHRVSRRNFISGLKKAKVPLEDRDLEKVVDRLAGPSGGKLSYQVLVAGVKNHVLKQRQQEKQRRADVKRKKDEHERIINAGGNAVIPGAIPGQGGHGTPRSMNISRQQGRPPSNISFGQSSSTGGPLPPLSHRDSGMSGVGQGSLVNVETMSKASLLSRKGFNVIPEKETPLATAYTRHERVPPRERMLVKQMTRLKLMSGDLGAAAPIVTPPTKKKKKKKHKKSKGR